MTCISNRLIEVFVIADYSLVPANFPEDVVKSLPEAVNRGIYFGWASVDNGPVYKMVMSIGWNPYYDNTEKSMVSSWGFIEVTLSDLQIKIDWVCGHRIVLCSLYSQSINIALDVLSQQFGHLIFARL